MVKARAAVIFMAIWAAAGWLSAYQTPSAEEVLRSSTDADALEHAAITLASSGKAAPIAMLGLQLRDPGFLARLEGKNGFAAGHSSRVLEALAEHATPQVLVLLESLAEDPAFVAGDQRKILVLELLAQHQPMSEQTAAVIERSNGQGYFAFNAQLLAENPSPRALQLFESMMLDQSVDAGTRVECLHHAIVPRRMQLAILHLATRILTRTQERAIARAAAESLFAYRQEWFSIESGITEPPAWPTASSDLLRAASSAADAALARHDLDRNLREKIAATRTAMTNALAKRGK